MDDLWDPPNYQATEDTYSFCLAYDVIEETDLNEKSCIQVLSVLIGKADNDIIELEEELMDLVTQLACTDEEFSDIFCTSLRAKTDILDLSIRKLKDDAQDFSSSSREPAESINDMLKSLFCCYLRKKDQQPDDESLGYTSICLVESSQETNAKQRITRELGFFLGNSNPEDNQEPEASLSQSLCLVDSSLKAKAKQNITKELGFSHGNSNPEDHQESKASLSQNLCLVDSSKKPKAKQNITKELGFCRGNSNPENHQEPKVSLSQSLCLVDSSRRPKVKQNSTKELGFFLGNSNPENHQEPKASLSQSLYSTKTYKRRYRLSSPWQTSSSSLMLLEEPKPLPILDVNVTNLHDMDYYTVDELKGIAKRRNMKGYFKLHKVELARLLGIKVTEGKGSRKERRHCPVLRIKGVP